MIADSFTTGLIWPAVVLAFLGWLVPRLLSLVFPEGVRPLVWLGLASTLIMLTLGMAAFLVLYIVGGVTSDGLLALGWGAALGHFLKLGAVSALLWGPIMLLSIAGLPRTWVHETW